MKAITALVFLFTFLIISCKKKDTNPLICNNDSSPQNTSSAYFPLKVGSIWVYESFKIDSIGLETSFDTDTVRIIDDTLINGHTFSIITGTQSQAQGQPDFLRDSAGYIVDTQGNIFMILPTSQLQPWMSTGLVQVLT